MADITLSNAVRSNLLSLQKTASLLGKTQNRLSTGLKVNSALDDPSAFFTASSLNSRAGDLNRLLDSIGNSVQTVQAANNGLTSITKLVETAQGIARQSLQKPLASPASVVGTAATVTADVAAKVTGAAIAADTAATITSTDAALADADVLALTGTLTITGPSGSYNLDFDATITDSASLTAQAALAATATGLTVAHASAAVGLTITAPSNTTSFSLSGNFTGDAALVAGLGTTVNPTNAAVAAYTGVLSVKIGDNTATTVDFGTVINRKDLQAALAEVEGGTVTFGSGGEVIITASDTKDDVVITGAAATLTSIFGALSGGNASFTTESTNASITALAGQSINVKIGSGAAQTITFGATDSSGQISSIAELETRLTAIQATFTGSTVELDANRNLKIEAGNSNDNVVLSATTNTVPTLTAFGIGSAIGTNKPTANADRSTLEAQYNTIRTQIDGLVTDARYNGVNLLDGDSLEVIFNETNTSSLKVTGVTFDVKGLGITEAETEDFQSNTTINSKLAELDKAIGTLRQQASTFGSNLSVVEVRQDFTKNLINTLESGAANLTLADTNQEGANLLALQTRQQLSSVALSLASQAEQNVLRLF